MVRFSDPFGNVLELFCGATYERTPALTPYGNRFVTGEQGLGTRRPGRRRHGGPGVLP